MPFPVAEMARRELRAALKHHEREIEALRAALQEADTIMGHDEDATEWRVKWERLWVGKAVTP